MTAYMWNYLAGYLTPGTRTNGGCPASTAATSPLESVEEESRRIAKEFVYYVARGVEPETTNGRRLRRISDSSVSRDELLGLLRGLDLRRENVEAVLQDIASSCLDGVHKGCNWGRVVTLYTFTGLVVQRLLGDADDGSGDQTFLEEFATSAAEVLAAHVSGWILAKGGWDTVRQMVPGTESQNRSELHRFVGVLSLILRAYL